MHKSIPMFRKTFCLFLPTYCLLLFGPYRAEAATGLVNDEVKRTVDLSTHLAKISAEIVLSNEGDSAVSSFVVALEPELAAHLAYFGASVSSLSLNDLAASDMKLTKSG